jgi:hypothetical protein
VTAADEHRAADLVLDDRHDGVAAIRAKYGRRQSR